MLFGRQYQKIELKCVPHVQHDYFSSFNQSEHYFLASSLPSSLLKGAYATGRLEHSGRQNDEKVLRKIGYAQFFATFFRHSTVLSHPAVLLFKLPLSSEGLTLEASAF